MTFTLPQGFQVLDQSKKDSWDLCTNSLFGQLIILPLILVVILHDSIVLFKTGSVTFSHKLVLWIVFFACFLHLFNVPLVMISSDVMFKCLSHDHYIVSHDRKNFIFRNSINRKIGWISFVKDSSLGMFIILLSLFSEYCSQGDWMNIIVNDPSPRCE